MPQNATVSVPSRVWTEITNGDATNITFQVGSRCLIKGTVGAVAPLNSQGALAYPGTSGEMNAALAELWPGVAGVNRVFAYSQTGTGVMVSHA